MSDARDKTAGKSGCNAVIVEVTLALLHLLLVEQAELSPFAVGKLIDDRPADVEGNEIVDAGTQVAPMVANSTTSKTFSSPLAA